MTPVRQAKRGGLLIGLIVAMVAVGILSAAMVKSLRSQAVTSARTYNLMRARYAADSGNNYFSLRVNEGTSDDVEGQYTLGNGDQFEIIVTTNVTNPFVTIIGRRMAGDDVLAVRVLTRELTDLTSGQQTDGVSTNTYSADDLETATSWWSAKWKEKVSDEGDGTTFYNQQAKTGGVLFDDTYTNFTLSVTAEVVSGSKKGGYGLYYLATIDPDTTDKIDGYCFQFDVALGKFLVNAVNNTSGETRIAEVAMSDTSNSYIRDEHVISIQVENNVHTIKIDGTTVFNFLVEVDGTNRTVGTMSYTVDDYRDESGSVGFRVWGNTKAEFTDLTVTIGNTTTEGGTGIITGF